MCNYYVMHHRSKSRGRIINAVIRPLPRDTTCCAVLVILILSVSPSVCPSVTLVDCVQMVRPTIMVPSPYGSPIILVFTDVKCIPKFEGVTPSD